MKKSKLRLTFFFFFGILARASSALSAAVSALRICSFSRESSRSASVNWRRGLFCLLKPLTICDFFQHGLQFAMQDRMWKIWTKSLRSW